MIQYTAACSLLPRFCTFVATGTLTFDVCSDLDFEVTLGNDLFPGMNE